MIERIVANGHGTLTPKLLAVHSTANPGASALNHVKLWTREPKFAVHAVSDWKEAYHTVPWDRLCYHVGNGNKTCIGIEICEATNDADFMRGLEVARQAIHEMLGIYGWDVDTHVRSHLWFTENYGGSDHTDPIPYLKRFGKSWEWFIDFLKEGTDMQKTDTITRPDGHTATLEQCVGYADMRLENLEKELMRTDDPTGRGKTMTTHEHVKWLAKEVADIKNTQNQILEALKTK